MHGPFSPNPETVAVLGLGYAGCVTAACLAELGHAVAGVDPDEHKVRSVRQGRAPFFEPGLDALVSRNVAAGRLSATTSLEEGLARAAIAFLCVGTPSERNGNLDLGQLRRVSAAVGALLPSLSQPLIVAVRSTVFPGTCEEVVGELLRERAPVVCNPEFLREGNAVSDFLQPSLVVVGGSDRAAVERVAQLYRPLGAAIQCVSLRAAEMLKYAGNAFHALKIAFANEMGALCANLGISSQEMMEAFFQDRKLNLSAAYLKPGFAFGGSCLPKDLRALNYRASRLDLKLPLLASILPSNEQHLARAVEAVLDLPARRLGIFGLAFKDQTDDLRESPVVLLLEHLLGKGRACRVFDPHVQLDWIYGSNRNFLLSSIPHIGRLLERRLEHLLGWADHLVLAQKPGAEAAEQLLQSGLPVLDLVGELADRPAPVTRN